MARLKQFDSKFAPGKYGGEVAAGHSDTNHEKVLALLALKTQTRSPEYVRDAVAFVEEWRRTHPEGYSKDAEKPGSVVLATIVAVSIRRDEKGR